MCLLFIANTVNKNYKLILAANRDEFYDRPAIPADFWKEHPGLLAGKDLKAGGTWLGITKTGRIAALTNYRDLKNIKPGAPSRGNITTDFLAGNDTPEEYYNNIKDTAPDYNGFNLLIGNAGSRYPENNLFYFSNISGEFKKLATGIYGLSNSFLDTSWPKVERIKLRLGELVNKDEFSTDDAFNILNDTDAAADELLPDTGIGIDLERLLSSVFIKSPVYGTRCSTLILIDREDKVTFIEKTYIPERDAFTDSRFEFILE